MKQYLLYILALLLVLMFQIGFLPPLLGRMPQPNLLLMAVMLTAVQTSETKNQLDLALIFALVSGLFLDLISSYPFGIFTASFLLIALASYFIVRVWFETGVNYKNIGFILFTVSILFPVIIEASRGELVSFTILLKSLLISSLFLLPLSFLYYVRAR